MTDFDGVEVKHTVAGVTQPTRSDEGTVTAVIATFGVKDLQNDVVLPTSISDGATVVISDWNHGAMDSRLPVGKGQIRVTPTEAILEGKFWIDSMPEARRAYEAVKAMGPSQEWSFGFKLISSYRGELNGEPVRFLERLRVFEASPVIVAAGINTRTLALKGDLQTELRKIRDRVLGVGTQGDQAAALAMTEFLRFQRIRSRALGV